MEETFSFGGKTYRKVYDEINCKNKNRRRKMEIEICKTKCVFCKFDENGDPECHAPAECWGCAVTKHFHWEEV